MNTTTNSTFNPPPSHPQPPRPEPRLRRAVVAPLGGVAGGIANYFGIEAKWVRIAFLVSLFLGGVGFLVYVALWLGLPDQHDPRPAKFAATQNLTRLIVAGIFSVFAVGSITSGAAISGSLLLPALLVGGGIYLLNQRDDVDMSLGGQHPKAEAPYASTGVVPPPPPGASGTTSPGPAPAAPVDDDRDPLLVEAERLMNGDFGENAYGADEPAHWATTRTEAAEVAVRRKRPPIVSFALGAAALISVLTFVSSSGGAPFVTYPAILLGMAVVGFIASMIFRRPAWLLVPISFVALLVTIASAVAFTSFDRGFGELSIEFGDGPPVISAEGFNFDTPPVPPVPPVPGADADDAIEVYSHGFGQLNLDLDDLELDADRTVAAELVAGQMNLDLSDDYRTVIVLVEDSEVFFDDDSERLNAGAEITLNPDANPTLTVLADLKAGQLNLDVDRDEATIDR